MKPRLLIAYSMAGVHVQATLDYICALKKYTHYDVDYLHVTHGAEVDVDLDAYDVVFHSYCARLCFEGYVAQSYQEKLRAYGGVKVLAVQDEYDLTDVLKRAIKYLGFDIVLTCVPQSSLEYVYPRPEFESVKFITVLTGYIPDEMDTDIVVKPVVERSIFLGYRGRDLSPHYGRLGYDKIEIGRGMKRICDARGIATDIAWEEGDRIYGDAWQKFVSSCRAMLGAESGSNIFDFDGSLRAKVAQMTKDNGGRRPTYEEFLPFIEAREGQIDMGQISPRVFECALLRTPMVLFRGRYSDAIRPNEHYIPLEKDLSNADEVLSRLKDTEALSAMADRAYEHLVGSGTFSYSKFCHSLELAFVEMQKVKGWRTKPLGDEGRLSQPVDLDDLVKAVLHEAPTVTPGSDARFKEKQKALSGLIMLREYRNNSKRWPGAMRRYNASAEAHVQLLEISVACDGIELSDAERNKAQSLVETCRRARVISEKYAASLELAASELLSTKLDGVAASAAALSDSVSSTARGWINAYSEFFAAVGDQLFEVHDILRSRVASLAQMRGKRETLRLRVGLWRALLKAPARVVVSFILRRMPAARIYVRRALSGIRSAKGVDA